MCGIAGILGKNLNNSNLLRMMLEVQKHRGPDAMNVWENDSVFLGHNRLSIIDLSTAANQPMESQCGNFCIVFNGEIYNYLELKQILKNDYTFSTNSDTEVLLAAFCKWNTKMLEKLNGMFSFVIWDKKKEKLFAARDRFGVKPFYFAINDNQFYFASEIKTLFSAAIPKNKNLKVWANYFKYGTYGLPNETFYNDIFQLKGGHYIELENQKKSIEIKQVQWYNFSYEILNKPVINKNELIEQYLYYLQDSISLRFRADVPLGMNVSGGLDSSILLKLVAQNLPSTSTIEAFTFYSNNEQYDELPWVIDLIKKTPYALNKVLLDYKKIPNLIEKISYFQDEPFGGFPTLAYSLLFTEAKRKGIKVILDGQGMDEAWAGYDYYQKQEEVLIQGLKNSSPCQPNAILKDFLQYAEKENYETPFDNKLQNLQYRDLFYTKIPRALRFNDRISMMSSTELREPFLDYRLVELAFSQPKELKFNQDKSKWLLREIVKDSIGDSLALAPKRAIQTPQREWIATELRDYFTEKIEHFTTLDYVNKTETLALWKDYCHGTKDNSFYIWQWVNTIILES
jgi:asparagine synthase (glutamine-hydrolysing)